jgi:predicted dehydrogenase
MVSNSLKVVQVGCGGIANAWMRAIKSLDGAVEVVGLVDLSRDQALKLAKGHGLAESLVFDSLQDAVGATGAEAVFDTTVPAAHAPVTIEALSLGCHVLGEKPMSDELEPAKRMVAAAKAAGRRYAVTQTRRPLPHAISVAEFLRSGALGAIEEVHNDFYLGAHFGGFRDEMDYPLILDMAIHTFDSARQIADADPVNVYCHTWNPPHSWSKGDMSAAAIFEMRGADGEPIVYTYRGSWVAEGNHTKPECDWRCVTAKGSLKWDGADGIHAERVKDGGDHGFHSEMEEVVVPLREMERTGHAWLIHDFVDAVRSNGRRKPMCDCEDNIKSLAMVTAAVESAKRGQRVPVTW